MEPCERHTIIAADGTRLAVKSYVSRSGKNAADIVITSGLSTTENFWYPLVKALSPSHRIHLWSYRGHGDSESAKTHDYAIKTHADDLKRVTDTVLDVYAKHQPVHHIAFSMGVTVLLEAFRIEPGAVASMVLVAGGADAPYASMGLFQTPQVKVVLRACLARIAPMAHLARPVTSRLAAFSAWVPLAQAVGAIGRHAPREEIAHFFRSVGAMDLGAYVGTMASLFDARATDVLPTIHVPTLIIAPERDVMATRADLEALHRGIVGAQWTLLAGTGHAVLLEAPDAVASAIQQFLSDQL